MTAATAPRLDVWLSMERGITRHAARVLLDAGLVAVNGKPGRPGHRMRDRDVVVVQAADAGGRAAADEATAPELDVVYEDDWLAVIDKPAGVVVHPAAGHHGDTVADALRQRGTTWSLLGGADRAGIVHRLDRDTSGLMVVARTEAAHRDLAAQLRRRALGREYWTLVHGGFREDSGTIEAPIGRDRRNRKRMAVVDSGREAVTDFVVSERLGALSALQVRLRTGRTHQIRVHMAYIRHPVVGDATYGRPEPGLDRPALHAARLTFIHPSDGRERTFESPLPLELRAFVDAVSEKRR